MDPGRTLGLCGWVAEMFIAILSFGFVFSENVVDLQGTVNVHCTAKRFSYIYSCSYSFPIVYHRIWCIDFIFALMGAAPPSSPLVFQQSGHTEIRGKVIGDQLFHDTLPTWVKTPGSSTSHHYLNLLNLLGTG